MVNIEVFGVGHIDSESRRVSQEIEASIDDKTLVFLEPMEEALRSPETIALYQRGFWTHMRDLSLSRGAKIVPLSHNSFPRNHTKPENYLGSSPGLPEVRLGVAVLLEEDLQIDWIDRVVSDNRYKAVVVIGDAHADRIALCLYGKGHNSTYTSLYDFDPETRFYHEITDLVLKEGKAKAVRLDWLYRVRKHVMDKTFELYRALGLCENDYQKNFDLVRMHKVWADEYAKVRRELLENRALEPSEDELLQPGCTSPFSIATHKFLNSH